MTAAGGRDLRRALGLFATGVTVVTAVEHEARRFAGLPPGHGEPEPQLDWPTGVPVLTGAIAWFAAEVVDRHEIGDHSLFIGQVRAFAARADDAAPLVFHRSRFGHLIEESGPLPTDPWGWTVDLWG